MIKDVYTVIHYDWFKPEPVVKSAYSTSSLDAARKILEENARRLYNNIVESMDEMDDHDPEELMPFERCWVNAEHTKWILDHYLFADEETFEIIHSTYVPSTTV
jgi:hypothetical protein